MGAFRVVAVGDSPLALGVYVGRYAQDFAQAAWSKTHLGSFTGVTVFNTTVRSASGCLRVSL